MSVHYLVDYENVHETGLAGMDKLTAEDCVYIFHTSAADRISLSRLENVQAWIKVIFVPPGKQSLDMHLGSFLGYLIGRGQDEDVFAIVSHDTDYTGIARFWNRTYQTPDKVKCIHGINYPLGLSDPASSALFYDDNLSPGAAVRSYILRVFANEAEVSKRDGPCMQVSLLCDRLNRLPEYKQERERLCMKPRQYLEEECKDILWIRRMYGVDWAYLLAAPVGEEVPEETAAEDAAAAAEENDAPVAAALPEEETAAEEIPDIMELGDLSIDDDAEAPDEYADPPFDPDPPAEEKVRKVLTEADFIAMARECMRGADLFGRNDQGHVRASLLRDELMKYPEFRAMLKESGMKPIIYLQQLLAGVIEIRREKGIYWAGAADAEANARDTALFERKKTFYETAFGRIREQLTGAGLDEAVADEIAGICMRSNAAVEPRKVIHTLLCQRFGNKAGAKYYRQAVKYICA